MTKNRTQPLHMFFIVFAALWLIFDLRMGLEFLSYAQKDLSSYIMKPLGQREFRNFGQFHDAVAESLPFLEQQSRYAFLGPDPAFFSLLRYFTYPSLPVRPGESLGGVTTWLVFERPDVTVDSDNRLVVDNGTVLSPAGRVMREFGPGTFLYQSH